MDPSDILDQALALYELKFFSDLSTLANCCGGSSPSSHHLVRHKHQKWDFGGGISRLIVGAASGSLLPCYESAYMWFSGPPQTTKTRNLCDHPPRRRRCLGLPPTVLLERV
ncbi:hypothetical protein M5K25_000339 [Dendrobium thyrsiflorum]|uniref:Uncharacterized protein n=1 Tax=Dendrobium thyrsiflorum TaxID=117978 RepID=A0ABD0VTD2_DENTH